MRKKRFDPISILFIAAGLVLLAYPFVSNYLREKNSTRAVSSYDAAVEALGDENASRILEEARTYNQQLFEENGSELPSDDPISKSSLRDAYWDILNITDSGMMGYITIPRLGETLPIYHGSKEEVLQVGVGHLEYTSFPVGGESTHAALSGHRGLTSAKLFTDLEQMQLGDKFYIRIMNEVFAYQVDQITTVEPNQLKDLVIMKGEDHVTLITCTPYGINSHRFLVRGSRIPYVEEEKEREIENAPFFISKQFLYPMIGFGAIALFLLIRKLISLLGRR